MCAFESTANQYVLNTSLGRGSVQATVVCLRSQASFRSVSLRQLKTPPTGPSPHVRGNT